MNPDDILKVVAIVGPGFVLLKVLYLFGGQHRRLEWEWVVWSVLIGIVLANLAGVLVGLGSFIQGPVDRDTVQVLTSFALAVAFGALLAWWWYRVKGSKRTLARKLYRYISDSAWDFVLEDAARHDSGVEIVVEVDKKEVLYYGAIDTFGQEVAEAEPWVYLTFVSRWDDVTGGYVPLSEKTEGMLFHKDNIKRMRFIAIDEPAVQQDVVMSGNAQVYITKEEAATEPDEPSTEG
jgi:hypothetical protein